MGGELLKIVDAGALSPRVLSPEKLAHASGSPVTADSKPFEGRFSRVASTGSMILNHGANLLPRGDLATSGDISGCHSGRGGGGGRSWHR